MTEKTFAGIPVEGFGEQPSYGRQVTQRPISELEPYIRVAINTESVEAIRWEQYTPYFNDGEPCYFGISDIRAKIIGGDDEDGDYGDGFLTAYDKKIKGGEHFEYSYEPHTSTDYLGRPIAGSRLVRTPTGVVYEPHPAFEPLTALSSQIGSGAFNSALLDLFGDHAQVTVRRDKIEVDTYEHE